MTGRFRSCSALMIVVAALILCTPAAAQRTRWTEVHGGVAGAVDGWIAGGTNALDRGGEIGLARDWSGRWNSYGFGASWIAGKTAAPEQQMWGMILSSTFRIYLPTETVRPYGELGANLYLIGYEKIDAEERERSFVNPGVSLGGGVAWRIRDDLDVRAGAALHFAKIDFGMGGGGEGEDWFTGLVGLSFH